MNKTDRKMLEQVKNEISAMGYELRFVDFCEDSEHPGFLGMANGLTDTDAKIIKVRKVLVGKDLLRVLEHELDHVRGKKTGEINDGLRCATFKVLG